MLNVTSNDRDWCPAAGSREVARGPKVPLPAHLADLSMPVPQLPGRRPLQAVDELGDLHLGRVAHQQMDIIVFPVHLDELGLEVLADLPEDHFQLLQVLCSEHTASVFRHKDQMHMHLENTVSSGPLFGGGCHRPMV